MQDDPIISEARRRIEDLQYEAALQLIEPALAGSKNPDLWNLKGVALRSMGRDIEANRCFEKALDLDPRDRNSS